jgi:peptidyl-prolyl cis-trans isomerase C
MRKRSPNEGEFGNPRFNSQKRKRNRAIAIAPSRRDMARLTPCQRREDVRKFIILTGFARCQCWMIGRVSAATRRLEEQGFSMTALPSIVKSARHLGLASTALAGCIALALLAALPVRAQEANPVLAKVNGAEIRASDVALAEEELGPSLAQMDPATKKENVLSFLIDMKIVSKEAEDKKIADRDDFKNRLAFARNRLLMDNLLAAEGKAATTDENMKKVYEDAAKQISGEQEVHARHILVETEDQAKKIEDELKKGADFAELAKKESKDPGASDGGDLGFFTKDQMVPEFSAVAFTLEPGKISDPVKTQFGWHVIKVEEKRARKAPDFEQVKPQIETYVVRKAQADYVAKLRTAAKVERLEKAEETAAKPDGAKAPAAKK